MDDMEKYIPNANHNGRYDCAWFMCGDFNSEDLRWSPKESKGFLCEDHWKQANPTIAQFWHVLIPLDQVLIREREGVKE